MNKKEYLKRKEKLNKQISELESEELELQEKALEQLEELKEKGINYFKNNNINVTIEKSFNVVASYQIVELYIVTPKKLNLRITFTCKKEDGEIKSNIKREYQHLANENILKKIEKERKFDEILINYFKSEDSENLAKEIVKNKRGKENYIEEMNSLKKSLKQNKQMYAISLIAKMFKQPYKEKNIDIRKYMELGTSFINLDVKSFQTIKIERKLITKSKTGEDYYINNEKTSKENVEKTLSNAFFSEDEICTSCEFFLEKLGFQHKYDHFAVEQILEVDEIIKNLEPRIRLKENLNEF